jgi:hypothetical protein
LSGFEVSPITRTGGSLISQENWNRWLFDFLILPKSYTGGSLISQESLKTDGSLISIFQRKAQTDGSLVPKTLRKKNRRLFLKKPK